jgi:uncharacterized protein with FMN-binding domain
MRKTGSLWLAVKRKLTGKKISNNLVTMSSAAILAVYAAGYERTKVAADRFELQAVHQMADAAPVAAIVAGATAPLPAFEAVPARSDSAPVPGNVANAPRPVSVAAESQVASNVIPDAASSTPASAENLAEKLVVPLPAPEPVPVREQVALVPEQRPVEPPPVAPAPPVRQSQYKDGSYTGWGTSRHGDIQANVVIQDGRIASAAISQCLTRYPCSWIAQLPGQVISRQNPTVDYVSGATQSVNAYYYAVVEALSKAK